MNIHFSTIIFHFKNKMVCSCIGEPIYDLRFFLKVFINIAIKDTASSPVQKTEQKSQQFISRKGFCFLSHCITSFLFQFKNCNAPKSLRQMKSEITGFLLIAAEKLMLFQSAAIKCQLPHPLDFRLSRVILRLLVKQTTFPQVYFCLYLPVLYCNGLQKKTREHTKGTELTGQACRKSYR